MSDTTPLQELEAAIEKFVRDTSAPDSTGSLTAWVLGYQESRINPDSTVLPLQFSSDYAMGTATSMETSLGLLKVTEHRLISMVPFDE